MLACPTGVGFETFQLIATEWKLRMLKWRCARMKLLTSYQH